MTDTPVMLLAAGRGTRLGDQGVPKILVEINGRPLLALQLEHLAAEGFTRVVINTHHLAEQVQQFAADYRGPVELVLVHEATLLGTAGGLANAWQALASSRATVVYGDVLLDGVSLRELEQTHTAADAEATLAAYRAPATPDKGAVLIDDEDRIVGFREKDPELTGEIWVNAGLMVVEQTLTADLTPNTLLDFGNDVFPRALAQGRRLQLHRLGAPVLDIGTPQALQIANSPGGLA